MAPPPRRARTPHRSSRRRGATLILVAGSLTVLGVTFALGVAAGRRWPTGTPWARSAGGAAETRAETPPRRAEPRGFDKDKTKVKTDPPPVLTFYRDLTAPMTSPPPPRVPSKPERVGAKASDEPKASSLAAASPEEARFTVQVGAFKVRAQAEALRARLAEGGQDAYVHEGEVGGVPQYRVRVGTFTTREAARDAAARLGAERHLGTYVTTR